MYKRGLYCMAEVRRFVGIVVENSCFIIFDLGRIVWEVNDLLFCIKGSFCFALCQLFIKLRVLGEDSEEVDIKVEVRKRKCRWIEGNM